jgi:hypothetical protein
MRGSCLLLVVLTISPGALPAADPPAADRRLADRVTRLVKQLGDEAFDRRQAAEKQLIALGPGILPILDKLGASRDPEVAVRIRRVRRALADPLDEIRDALKRDLPLVRPDSRWDLDPRVPPLIAKNQPKAGDFLLSIIKDPGHPLHRPAVNAFVQNWDTMTAGQQHTYLQHSLILKAEGRGKYPREVDAKIGLQYAFRYGWGGRPAAEKLRLVTETTHFLDGKPYGAPYRYPYPSSGCTTGWVKPRDLSLGRHTVSLRVRYEASHGGKKVTGTVESEKFSFRMLSADTPDDLIAPRDAKIAKLVRSALRVAETENELLAKGPGLRGFPPFGGADPWRPQITWQGKKGEGAGLHVPVWRVERVLPVDLCFEVTLQVVGTGKEYPADPVIYYKGQTGSRGYFSPREVRKVTEGRSGFVPVRLILKPSRALALTDPKVTHYFPEKIVTGVLRMKVGPPTVPAMRP